MTVDGYERLCALLCLERLVGNEEYRDAVLAVLEPFSDRSVLEASKSFALGETKIGKIPVEAIRSRLASDGSGKNEVRGCPQCSKSPGIRTFKVELAENADEGRFGRWIFKASGIRNARTAARCTCAAGSEKYSGIPSVSELFRMSNHAVVLKEL